VRRAGRVALAGDVTNPAGEIPQAAFPNHNNNPGGTPRFRVFA
jgi:hypothetical protein